MPIPLTRKIGGSKFHKIFSSHYKEECKKEAALLRKKGKLARIFREPEYGTNKVWAVYIYPGK